MNSVRSDWQTRPCGVLLLLAMSALPGCAARQPAGPAAVPVEALLGTYELVSIEGRPLPVREFQAIYHAGRITLNAGERYVSEIDAETCTLENVCTRETTVSEGRWVVLEDGTLEFNPPNEGEEHPEEEVGPPPRFEADGREIRYYTPSVDIPIFTYRRR